jgi:hypothetical protein
MTVSEHIGLTLQISVDQLLQALLQLPAEDKNRLIRQLNATPTSKLAKKVSFTVLKTQGKSYKFNRDEANAR